MAVVAVSSYRRSRPVSLQLARAVARRTDLFGYAPDVLRLPGGVHLSLSTSEGDHAALERQHALWGDGPVPIRADGAIAMAGDRVGTDRIASIDPPDASRPDGSLSMRSGASMRLADAELSWSS